MYPQHAGKRPARAAYHERQRRHKQAPCVSFYGPGFRSAPHGAHAGCVPCSIISVDNPVDKSWQIMTGKLAMPRSGPGRYVRTCHVLRRAARLSVRPVLWHGSCMQSRFDNTLARLLPVFPVRMCCANATPMHVPCQRAGMLCACAVLCFAMHAACHAALHHWHGACRAHVMPCHGMDRACCAPCPPHAYAMPCRPMAGTVHGRP